MFSHKRIRLGFILLTALVLLLGGCSGTPASQATDTQASATEAPKTTAPAAEEPKVPSGEKIKLEVGVYERGNTTNTYGSATENYWTRWIQTQFGDANNIDLTYIPIPRSEESAKVNTLMASGTAPDVILNYDSSMMFGFARDGGLTPLDDLIASYGPNIAKNLAASLPYGKYDGQQYLIPAVRAKVGRYTTFIRKDWLDQMGYAIEKNSEGLYHMSKDDFDKLLHDAKSTDFDGTGMEIYPLGVAGAYNATQQKGLLFAFVDAAQVTDEIVASTPQMLWPGFKDGVAYLNKLYNEKIIDPDFMVDTDTALPSFSTQVSTGRTLAYSQDDMYSSGVKALYDVNPNAEFIAFQLDNVHGKQIITCYQPVGMYVAVPATAESPEAAVKYLNFLADYDTCMMLSYGIEGKHYNMVDGQPITITYEDQKKAIAEIEGFERITCGDLNLMFNGQPFGFKNSLPGQTPTDTKYNLMYDQAIVLSTIGGVPEYSFKGIRTEAEEKYDGFISNLEDSLPQLIACPTAKFEDLWEQVTSEYLNSGGQEIIDQKSALFRELEADK